MALEFAHGAIQALAANGVGVTYTVSGLTFQPKALRFYWQGLASAVDAASQATHSRRGVGFATSTTRRSCVCSQSQDAALAMVCTAAQNTFLVVGTVTSTPAFDGALDIDLFAADGFRLITDIQLPVNLTVFWEAWGGSDIVAADAGQLDEPATSGAQSVAHNLGSGNTPSVLMCAFVNGGSSATRADSGLTVGFATGTADADNIVVVGNNDDGSAAADTDGYGRAGDCIALITTAGGNPSARAKVTNFALTGTTAELTWASATGASRLGAALWISGGNWKAGGLTINGNTGSATATVSGLAFTPIGLSTIGRMTTESAAGTSTAEDRISLGSGSSTSSRRAMGVLDENGTAACEIDHVIEYDEIVAYPSTAGGVQSGYDLNAMNADGFQLIVDTAGGVASEWVGYLTFGNISSDTQEWRGSYPAAKLNSSPNVMYAPWQ